LPLSARPLIARLRAGDAVFRERGFTLGFASPPPTHLRTEPWSEMSAIEDQADEEGVLIDFRF
jgi:hypothetical protein